MKSVWIVLLVATGQLPKRPEKGKNAPISVAFINSAYERVYDGDERKESNRKASSCKSKGGKNIRSYKAKVPVKLLLGERVFGGHFRRGCCGSKEEVKHA